MVEQTAKFINAGQLVDEIGDKLTMWKTTVRAGKAVLCAVVVLGAGCATMQEGARPNTGLASARQGGDRTPARITPGKRFTPRPATRNENDPKYALEYAMTYAVDYALECALVSAKESDSPEGATQEALAGKLKEYLQFGLQTAMDESLKDAPEEAFSYARAQALAYGSGPALDNALDYALNDVSDQARKNALTAALRGAVDNALHECLGEALALAQKGEVGIPAIWPVDYPKQYVSSRFGAYRSRGGGHGSRTHQGVDIVAPCGTPVYATAGGQITFAGRCGGYGNIVRIDHLNGYQTWYAHLNSYDVQKGDHVACGEKVGDVGSTGRSSANHLHYEVCEDGRAVDPERFLP